MATRIRPEVMVVTDLSVLRILHKTGKSNIYGRRSSRISNGMQTTQLTRSTEANARTKVLVTFLRSRNPQIKHTNELPIIPTTIHKAQTTTTGIRRTAFKSLCICNSEGIEFKNVPTATVVLSILKIEKKNALLK
ncbi:hypothetical protein SNE40_021627 [Patella caerulea]|uniref:Uncharacterized protein n=1 Tax=Patella caerulea TaxID=87958 RepID=A0AAN8GCT6_PATCE